MKYVFPGMGATKDMYPYPWTELENCVFLDWPKSFEGESVSDVADFYIKKCHFTAMDTIIGSSFGGIVACEIGNNIDLENIVLVGSAKRKSEISGLLKLLSPLIDYTPLEFVRMAAGKLPSDLSKMFHETDSSFVRKMCRAIFSWNGLCEGRKVLRIHGRRDRVIPLPENVDVVLDGGHLIAMTHPNECVSIIKGEPVAGGDATR